MQKTDEELMFLYQGGEEEAFDELFFRYQKRLFSYLKMRLKSEEAEEVFQEVFRKMHEFRHRYDVSYPFAPWFFTLTRHVVIDFYRKNRKVEKTPFSEEVLIEQEKEKPMELDVDLSALSLENQKIISMRYFEGKEFSDMARELSLTEVNVRKKMSRAMQMLRKRWRS